MSHDALPELSVVIPTPDSYATIRDTMRHLSAQTVRDRLEVVIVAPSRAALQPDEAELGVFCRWQAVEVGPMQSVAWARAAGARHASAPVVAFAEDHSFPAPGWAAALIAAYHGPWAAVGPSVRNATPARG